MMLSLCLLCVFVEIAMILELVSQNTRVTE